MLVAATHVASECLRGMAQYAQEHDWHLVTDMLSSGRLPQGWEGDGVLAVLPYQPELLAYFQESGMPCIACTGTSRPGRLPRVGYDNNEIGRIAADHLIERAYRSYAWAPFLNDEENGERFDAFQRRLAEHGCTCRSLPPVHVRLGPCWEDNWTKYRRSLAAELRRMPRPTAVFAFNDCVASEIVDSCADLGLLIPDEIAVLGVGDSITCETSPVPLSSVDPDMREIGYRAAAALDCMMNGDHASPPIRVPPKGVVTRVSTNVVAVKNPRLARALTYIAEHFPDHLLSVGDVADAIGMSRRNLERSFREEIGGTIKEHINSIRMQEASRLLKAHPRAKCSDIGVLIGLADAGTFYRTFRRFFGVSPMMHRAWAARTPNPAGTHRLARRPQPLTNGTALAPSCSARSTAA